MATTNSEATSDDEGVTPMTANTTVTTEVVGEAANHDVIKKEQTIQFTHLGGVRGISHNIDGDGGVHLRPMSSARHKTSSRAMGGARSGKKIRSLVSFKPRQSHFDRHNVEAAKDPFRGFYTLFWIGLGIMVLNTFYASFSSTGQILSLTFATLFSRDAFVLALSDGALVLSTFVCVPFALVLKRGWARYWPTLVWLQHAWQAALLGCVIQWTHYRDWPWVQSGFFVLHTLSMMMKMHSYMAVNGSMADNYWRMKRLEGIVEERVVELDGGPRDAEQPVGKGGVSEEAWQRAIQQAKRAEDDLLANHGHGSSDGGDGGGNVETRVAKSPMDGLAEQRGTSVLRQRANESIVERRRSLKAPVPQSAAAAGATASAGAAATTGAATAATGAASEGKKDEQLIRDPHPLANHPDKIISDLCREIEQIREDLTSSQTMPATEGSFDGALHETTIKTVTWPSNVTLVNFCDYLLVPTLVYELSYPRTKGIRPLYLLEKALSGFGTFLVIYVITEHWIMPRQPDPSTPLLRTFLELAFPMMINYLLIFYVIFEACLAFFAELTCFADRLFYEDWWNSTSMDVFSRKWNRPVHTFLLR